MSYSIFCKFHMGKFLFESNNDELKNLCSIRYSADLEDIDVYSGNAPDPKQSIEFSEYVGILDGNKDLTPLISILKKNPAEGNFDYVIDKKDLDTIKGYLIPTDIKNPQGATVGVIEKANVQGNWYDRGSFIKGAAKYSDELKERNNQLEKMMSCREGIDYYKLSSEQQNDLNVDIADLKDDILDLNAKVYACTKMKNILDFIENDLQKIDGVSFSSKDPALVFIYSM